METLIFPYANIVAGIMILVIGVLFHWAGQIIALCNWPLAEKIGIAEKGMIPEYKAYEKGIAAADAILGWIYGVAAIGLILNLGWAYKLAWLPSTVFIYHGLSFWFWTGNQIKLGHNYNSSALRIGWPLTNIITGIFVIMVIW